MWVGTMKPARRAFTCSRSSSAVTLAPGRSTMTAPTSSPRVGSGTPMTAQSATAGCSKRAASTCTEYTFSPPRMIMSLARSTM